MNVDVPFKIIRPDHVRVTSHGDDYTITMAGHQV